MLCCDAAIFIEYQKVRFKQSMIVLELYCTIELLIGMQIQADTNRYNRGLM